MKKDKIVAVLLSLALVLGLAACGGNGKADTSGGAEDAAETAADAGSAEANGTEPASQAGEQGRVEELTVAMTKDENADNEAVPWMVEDDYTVNEDHTVFTMTLKEGQKWHDGEPVTAEDVKFTFDYVKTQSAGRWITIASVVKDVAVSGNEITFTLAEPNPSFIRDGLADMR